MKDSFLVISSHLSAIDELIVLLTSGSAGGAGGGVEGEGVGETFSADGPRPHPGHCVSLGFPFPYEQFANPCQSTRS